MRPNILASLWQTFEEVLTTSGIGERELESARVVFYAGGGAVLDFIVGKVAEMEDDAANQVIDSMWDEFNAFAQARLPREH